MPLFLSEQELINIICAKGAEMNHSEFKRILENCVDKYGFHFSTSRIHKSIQHKGGKPPWISKL